MPQPRSRLSSQAHLAYDIITAANYGGTSGVRTSVALKPIGNAFVQDSGINNAYMTLDGLFTPFVVNNSTGNYPPPLASGETRDFNYNLPVMFPTTGIKETLRIGSASGMINAYSLNPFDSMSVYYQKDDNFHGIALRGPVMIAGWGADTADRIVPTGVDNYAERKDLYKVGPLDVRWNETTQTWQGGEKIDVVRLVKDQNSLYDIYNVPANIKIASGVSPTETIGLEYTTVCSGEQLYAYDLTEKIGYYSVLTRPVRGVRVISGLACVNNILYVQYSYIGTQFVAGGYTLQVSGNKVTAVPTSSACDDLNSQPSIVSVPLFP